LKRKLSTSAGVVALASLLGACGATSWFSSSDDKARDAADSKPATGPSSAAASAPPAPDWDEIRAKMAEGLIPDRKNVRHSNVTIPRQSEELDPPAKGTTGKLR